MESENNKNVKVNFGLGGFSTLLTIVFIVLKLCHVIEWSWIWVLAPTWISIAIGFVLFLVTLVFAAIVSKR